MDIKREEKEKVVGRFTAKVTVESAVIQINGEFELDDYDSPDMLQTQVEMAIRNQIGIEVLSCKQYPKAGNKSDS